MPFIRDVDEDKYYDKQELRQIVQGTGLFPPGFKGRGLFPPGNRSSGYGYQIVGDGVVDSLTGILKFAKENKDIIKSVVGATSDIVSTIKSSSSSKTPKLQTQPVHQVEVINKEALKKLRKNAGLPVGSGFRFD